MASLFRTGSCAHGWVPSHSAVHLGLMDSILRPLYSRTVHTQSCHRYLHYQPMLTPTKCLQPHHLCNHSKYVLLCRKTSCYGNSFHGLASKSNLYLASSFSSSRGVSFACCQNAHQPKLFPHVTRTFISSAGLRATDDVISSKDTNIELDESKSVAHDLDSVDINPELIKFYSQFQTEFVSMNDSEQDADDPYNKSEFENTTLAVSGGDLSDYDTHLVTGDARAEEEVSVTDPELEILQKAVRLPQKAGEKAAIQPIFNLAGYVNQSETLTKLLKMGVDLSAVELVPGAANLILKLEFERDIEPYLLFLHDLGVADADLGTVITRNPLIFKEHLDDLQVRVNYFESKAFSREAITKIIVKSPRLFSMTTANVDRRLGYYQKEFHLTGNEVRTIITRLPKLITWDHRRVKDMKMRIRDFLGFSETEAKEIFLAEPKVYLLNRHVLLNVFDYLHNTIGLTHKQLLVWPDIFTCRQHIIQNRHLFLVHLDRAQYDASKENYVSPKALVTGTDSVFCLNVAKSSVSAFNDFMKTL